MATETPTAATTSMRAGRYGTVLEPSDLAPGGLPAARGTLSDYLARQLAGVPRRLSGWPAPDDGPLFGEDGALALYCLYELHYRGFTDVDDGWEWEPSLLALRAELEDSLESELRQAADEVHAPPPNVLGPDDVPAALREIIDSPTGPSLSTYLAEEGSLAQFREFAIHRSILQLKEADLVCPDLSGQPSK